MKKLLVLLLLLCVGYIFRHDILREYALFFEIDDATKGADVIIVLAGHPTTRTIKACQLYKDGYSQKILITSPKEEIERRFPFLPNQTELMRLILNFECNADAQKIPSNKGGATSTIDEAVDFARFAKEQNISRAILVTDAFHMRRARYIYEKIAKKFDLNVTFQSGAARNSIYNESNWYTTEAGLQDYVNESAKSVMYLFIDNNLNGIKEQ